MVSPQSLVTRGLPVLIEAPAARSRALGSPVVVEVLAAPGLAVIAYGVDPHPHVPADHHDPVQYVTEAGVILVAMVVAGRLLVRAFAR